MHFDDWKLIDEDMYYDWKLVRKVRCILTRAARSSPSVYPGSEVVEDVPGEE